MDNARMDNHDNTESTMRRELLEGQSFTSFAGESVQTINTGPDTPSPNVETRRPPNITIPPFDTGNLFRRQEERAARPREEEHQAARIKPRAYDGQGVWREYKNYFERVAKMNRWDEEERVAHLWINIEGMALEFLDNTPGSGELTYREICRKMDERFGDEQLKEVYKAQLRTRRKKSGEGLRELGQDIRRLVQLAYPGQHNYMDEICIEKYREAIDDKECRLAIHRFKPDTLEDAIRIAVDTESWQISENQNRASRPNVLDRYTARAINGENLEKEEVEEPSTEERRDYLRRLSEKERREYIKEMEWYELREEMDRRYLMPTESRPQRPTPPRDLFNDKSKSVSKKSITCFRCGGKGHFARKCQKALN
jgi:hypothetical protein